MTRSLAFRAALAVMLMVTYVALSLAMIAGLVWSGSNLLLVPHAVFAQGIALVFLLAAVAIAWSVLPRIDKFEPPGPEVSEAEQPALFAEIRRVAEVTGERMPEHVYLMWQVNAFVAQRGGVLGLGSRRVMGIGMPLLRLLTVSEVRAVLAHEMGHFVAGDTRLSPWIYKTRASISRTVGNLIKTAQRVYKVVDLAIVYFGFVVVIAPFRWFGAAFLRITQSISRAQELTADRVAARCEGVVPLVESLKKTVAGCVAHELYMKHEIVPVVMIGKLPPIGEGFSQFVRGVHLASLLGRVVDHELAAVTSDPYDSHPPLRDRIAALGQPDERALDSRPATELVANVAALEKQAIDVQLGKSLEAISWADMPALWAKDWRKTTSKLVPHVASTTIGGLPTATDWLFDVCRNVEGDRAVRDLTEPGVHAWASFVIGAALTVALLDVGFRVVSEVGEPPRLRKDDLVVEPIAELADYLAGKLDASAWRVRWERRGLAEHPLAA